MATYPLCVQCSSPSEALAAGLYRLQDGGFQVIAPGHLSTLLLGPDHILATSSLAEALAELCASDIRVQPATILVRATGERFTSHQEVIPARELTAEEITCGTLPDGRAWRFGHSLFVAPLVRDELVARGFTDLEFSEGLSNFG